MCDRYHRDSSKEWKLYVSAIFDCYDLDVLGLSMSDNMKTELCTSTIENMVKPTIGLWDDPTQWPGKPVHKRILSGRVKPSWNHTEYEQWWCHDNARCEAMWARMKEELLYGRYDTKQMTIEELKTLIWRYFIIYWNRRICSANGGLHPMTKRKKYYESLGQVA